MIDLRFSPLSLEFQRKDTDKSHGKKKFLLLPFKRDSSTLFKDDAFCTFQKQEIPGD